MLVPMKRIKILAPSASSDELLRALHRIGTVQLIPFEAETGMAASVFGPPPPSRTLARITDMRELVAGVAEGLSDAAAPPALVREAWALPGDQLARRVDALRPLLARLAELQARKERLLAEESRLNSYRHIIGSLRPVIGRLPALRGYGATAVIIRARYRAVLSAVREELEELTEGRCEMVAADIDGDRVAALILYPLASAERVRTLLGGRDLEELTLPEELSGLPFDELVERLGRRIQRAADERAEVDAELAALSRQHAPDVAALRLVLADREAEARALASAAASDHLVMLSGWVPANQLGRLRDTLAEAVGAEVWIEERDPRADEDVAAPVAIQNPPLLQAFAPLASFVSLPRYGTIDPTPILALSFPVFVGLMVGDVAYGLILLGLLMLARRRWRHAAWIGTITPIVALAALSTIVFGFMFGEAFGDLGHRLLGLEPILFDRQEAVTEFLLLALAIGAGQVGIGLVLGIVNALLQHHSREVVTRAGLLVVLLTSLAALGWLVGLVPEEGGRLALVVLAVAVAVLIASLGLAGPVEAIGMLGNVLSYARLMAIGMASVMLAVAANRLGGVTGNILLGLFVAALLHAVNLALGFFDSSVQGLRLHYVEFFSKFVEPGGTQYRPFASVLPLPTAVSSQQRGT